jgi:MFS transporter, SP family, arabinose:H+ symporter
MYQLLIVIGSIAAIIAAYIIVKLFDDTVSWRWMFGSQMLFVIPFIVFLFLIPESPRWLAERNRSDEALEILTRIEGSEYAKAEMLEIEKDLSEETGTFAELFGPGMRKILLIGLLLAFFNMWTGWSATGGYVLLLLEKSGLSDRASGILQVGVTYSVMGAFTLLSCFWVDRFGRRPLWTTSAIIMIAMMAALGIIFYFGTMSTVLLVSIFCICAVSHSLGFGPLPWLMMSEIFPTRLRAKAVSITTTFVWCAVIQTIIFPSMLEYSEKVMGSTAGVFWFYGLVCVGALFFGLKVLPETKGKTLENISQMMKRKD